MQPGRMPVVVSCGVWNQAGWFLQRLGGVWRWHVGGVDCDGGQPAEGRWMHLAAVYDGQSLRLYRGWRPGGGTGGQRQRVGLAGRTARRTVQRRAGGGLPSDGTHHGIAICTIARWTRRRLRLKR